MSEESASYFTTPSLNGLIQQLNHLCQFGADALVVQGEQGAGKTALLTHFAEQLQAKTSQEIPLSVATMTGLDDGDADEALNVLVSSLGLSWEADSSGELMSRLRSYVQALLRDRQLAIVLVDDADMLSAEALGAMLSLLQNDSDVAFGLKFVFFSSPGFAQRVDDVGLVELAVYDFDMPSFSAAEMEQFLSRYGSDLDEARERDGSLTSTTLWSRSRGLPGKALEILEKLNVAHSANLAKDLKTMPVLHLVVVAVLVAGLLLTILYRRDGDAPGSPAQAEVEAPRVALLKPDSELSVGTNVSEQHPDAQTVSVEAAGLSAESARDGESSGAVKVLDATFAEQAHSNLDPEQGGRDVVQTEPSEALSSVAAQSDLTSTKERAEKVRIPPQPKPSGEDEAALRMSAGEKQLLTYAGSAFVLQMLAASQKKNLEQFMATQSNADTLSMYRKRRDQGGTWYVVVSGPFVTKSEAQRAILNLPKNQRQAGPWPRSVASVQAEIRNFHGLQAP